MHGAQTGLRDHGELIQLHLVKYSELWRCSADCKVLADVALYEGAMAHGLVQKAARLLLLVAAGRGALIHMWMNRYESVMTTV